MNQTKDRPPGGKTDRLTLHHTARLMMAATVVHFPYGKQIYKPGFEAFNSQSNV